jgi:hypothetical protein
VVSLQVRLILKERDEERMRAEYRKREIQRRENKRNDEIRANHIVGIREAHMVRNRDNLV